MKLMRSLEEYLPNWKSINEKLGIAFFLYMGPSYILRSFLRMRDAGTQLSSAMRKIKPPTKIVSAHFNILT